LNCFPEHWMDIIPFNFVSYRCFGVRNIFWIECHFCLGFFFIFFLCHQPDKSELHVIHSLHLRNLSPLVWKQNSNFIFFSNTHIVKGVRYRCLSSFLVLSFEIVYEFCWKAYIAINLGGVLFRRKFRSFHRRYIVPWK